MANLRNCLGSARFGIEAHDAPPEDFPVQPSQKDGLGRMCKPHWNAYTAGLARDAKARRAADPGDVSEATATTAEPIRTRTPRGRREADAEAEVAPEPSAG